MNDAMLSTETIGRILACNAFSDVAQSLLAPISQEIGASSSVLLQISRTQHHGDHVGSYVHFGRCPEAAQTYVDDGIFRHAPKLRSAMSRIGDVRHPAQPQLSCFGLLPYGRGMDCYRDFQESFDIGSVLAVALPIASFLDPAVMCIAFHRSRLEDTFGHADYARLQSLLHVVRAAIANIANSESLAISGAMPDIIVRHAANVGWIVLDDDLCVRQASRRGLVDLGLLTSDGTVSGASGTLSDVRVQLLEREARAPESCVIDCDDMAVQVRPFRAPGGEDCYLLITGQPAVRERMAAAQDTSLSDRETEVATLICGGQSNASIAGLLGISPRTVENHLRSIYGKLDIHSRTQLVSRLLTH